jgi:hypothetical protein
VGAVGSYSDPLRANRSRDDADKDHIAVSVQRLDKRVIMLRLGPLACGRKLWPAMNPELGPRSNSQT